MKPAWWEQMRGRADAATPGPWRMEEVEDSYWDAEDGPVSRGIAGPNGGLNTGGEYEMFSVEDAAFIARARTDVPFLLTLVADLAGALEEAPCDERDSLCTGACSRCAALARFRAGPEEEKP